MMSGMTSCAFVYSALLIVVFKKIKIFFQLKNLQESKGSAVRKGLLNNFRIRTEAEGDWITC